jgi:hypothetical protein
MTIKQKLHLQSQDQTLIPKGQRPFLGLFLEFGQPIVDVIFVQRISNFW